MGAAPAAFTFLRDNIKTFVPRLGSPARYTRSGVGAYSTCTVRQLRPFHLHSSYQCLCRRTKHPPICETPAQKAEMAFLGSNTTSAAASSSTGDISKDVPLNQPPEDSISDLSFSPASDHLAVASWDKKVRIYQINDQGQSEGKAMFEHEAPVLSCCWSPVSLSHISYLGVFNYQTLLTHCFP